MLNDFLRNNYLKKIIVIDTPTMKEIWFIEKNREETGFIFQKKQSK